MFQWWNRIQLNTSDPCSIEVEVFSEFVLCMDQFVDLMTVQLDFSQLSPGYVIGPLQFLAQHLELLPTQLNLCGGVPY